MSIDIETAPKINDCTACYGTGIVYWSVGEEYEVATCDWCKGEVTRQ